MDTRDTNTIRVLIAAPRRLYREVIAASLSRQPGLVLAGCVTDAAQAVQAQSIAPVDIIVVDVSSPAGIGLVQALAAAVPAARLLACAVDEGEADVMECARAGAAGYVAADSSLDELVAAIQRLARGELVCPPRIAALLFRHAGRAQQSVRPADRTRTLTLREGQVYALLREGRSNKEIAATLTIAQTTVKNHVHQILDKLAVANRTQAVAALGASARVQRPRRLRA